MFIQDNYFADSVHGYGGNLVKYMDYLKLRLEELGIVVSDKTVTGIDIGVASQINNAGLPSWFLDKKDGSCWYGNCQNGQDGGRYLSRGLWFAIDDISYCIYTNSGYRSMGIMSYCNNGLNEPVYTKSTCDDLLQFMDKFYNFIIIKREGFFYISLYNANNNISLTSGGFKQENMDTMFNLQSIRQTRSPQIPLSTSVSLKSMLDATKGWYNSTLGDRQINKMPISNVHAGFNNWGYWGKVDHLFSISKSADSQYQIISMGGELFLFIPQFAFRTTQSSANNKNIDGWYLVKC